MFVGDSFLFNTRDNVDAIFNQQRLQIIILQVSIVGIIAVGVTQVIITGGIDLSSGSVVAATAMIAMSFAQVSTYPRAVYPGLTDLPVIVPIAVGLGVRLARRADQRRADRLHEDSALHRHPRHDGDGARHRQMVVEGPADLVSRPNPSRRSARA